MKMSTKYPILLVHGLMLKDFRSFKAIGRIEGFLRGRGYSVYTCNTDGVGTIENNARQLKRQILCILRRTGAKKINLIAHSKGGLDSRYMIEHLGMSKYVASLTFLCTPHYGSEIASRLYSLPSPIKKALAAYINLGYWMTGDKAPDVLTVCRQLRRDNNGVLPEVCGYEGVYLQSYSTTLDKSRNDFVMGIPLIFSRKYETSPSDGLVSEDSSKFGSYRGKCLDESISHTQIVDLLVFSKKRQRVYDFYLKLCEELSEGGF
jgi:triacylglycerol lipase